jgi:hypothetical protein
MLTRRLKPSLSCGIVAAGTALALASPLARAQLTKDLVFDPFQPPLIFKTALFLPVEASSGRDLNLAAGLILGNPGPRGVILRARESGGCVVPGIRRLGRELVRLPLDGREGSASELRCRMARDDRDRARDP